MLRNQPQYHYFEKGMDRHPYPEQLQAPSASKLEPKDERLLELSQQLGQIQGQYDLLTEDNRRLEEENGSMRKEIHQLTTRNRTLEDRATEATAAHRSAESIIDEIEAELKSRKANKKEK